MLGARIDTHFQRIARNKKPHRSGVGGVGCRRLLCCESEGLAGCCKWHDYVRCFSQQYLISLASAICIGKHDCAPNGIFQSGDIRKFYKRGIDRNMTWRNQVYQKKQNNQKTRKLKKTPFQYLTPFLSSNCVNKNIKRHLNTYEK